MATFHDRTVAPKFQGRLLRPTLAVVEAEFAELIAYPWPGALSVQSDPKPAPLNPNCSEVGEADLGENQKRSAEPLVAGEEIGPQPCSANDLDPKQALVRLTAPHALLPLELDTAAQARALHMRRELRKGLDHGLALMDALDLTPRGLDVMDSAIARLDAMDAPGEDLEDDGLAEDEPDDEDDDPAEETSLETAGRGFVRCGADDDEDGFDIEQTNEDGSDDGRTDHGWFAGEFDVPQVMRGMMEDARCQSAVAHG